MITIDLLCDKLKSIIKNNNMNELSQLLQLCYNIRKEININTIKNNKNINVIQNLENTILKKDKIIKEQIIQEDNKIKELEKEIIRLDNLLIEKNTKINILNSQLCDKLLSIDKLKEENDKIKEIILDKEFINIIPSSELLDKTNKNCILS
jgi:hypothetical protein